MDKIWVLTFEYKDVAKVGGLGEVPYNQIMSLKERFTFTVFIPSHGQIERLKRDYKYEKLPVSCQGIIDLKDLNVKNFEKYYEIAFTKFFIKDTEVILLSGENDFTKKHLDDTSVYNPDTFKVKLALFSLGMKYITEYFLKEKKSKLPQLIHLHDYHAVIPFISMKQLFFKNKVEIPSIITIHLLTYPRYDLEFLRACGIGYTPLKIRLKVGFESFTIEEIYELASFSNERKMEKVPTMEKIGAMISDLVISVSESYLKSDIIPNLGRELISFKTDFVWNGCNWNYKKMRKDVMANHGKDIREILELSEEKKITRKHMREYLLTHKLGNLDRSPLINSQQILDVINEISNGNPFVKNGRIKAFKESGPLAITTGRLSPQKGFDTILKAIPSIIEKIPNAKFLFLILPTEYSLAEIKQYAEFVKKYQENLRIIFGVASDIFNLAHICANVYCALSRWEPFGIIALEAMASKLPVIATKVGGLQESMIDIREDPEMGTGLLIEKDNEVQLIKTTISLFKLAELVENENDITKIKEIIEEIPIKSLQVLAQEDPAYYNKLRENCFNRVENYFRWNIVSKKLKALYERLINQYKYHNT